MQKHKHNNLRQVYLVGGAVRDQMLGYDSHDMDYVVVGASVAEMKALGFTLIGKDFPVFLHPTSKHEYALARTERKIGAGYTGFSVVSGKQVTLEEDLARRDLTINAMAIDDNGQLIDPFKGKYDLENKVLKHTTAAFSEDPVRVLRLARFKARYGNTWTIHPDTKTLVTQIKNNGELSHLVPERVWKETEKALMEDNPQIYFEALLELGVLADIFPELEAMIEVPQPPEHHPEGDVFVHTMLVLKQAADLGYDLATRFAALTHDFGKPISYLERANLHGHEADGVPVIEQFCERLRIPNKLRDLAKLTSDNHLRCHKIFELKAKTIQKLIIDKFDAVKQPERFTQFLQACQCDAQGRGPTRINVEYKQRAFVEAMRNALAKLDTKDIVQKAILAGKVGPELGECVRIAQIECVRMQLKQH